MMMRHDKQQLYQEQHLVSVMTTSAPVCRACSHNLCVFLSMHYLVVTLILLTLWLKDVHLVESASL